MPGSGWFLRSRRAAVLVILVGLALAGAVLLAPSAPQAEPRSATGLSSSAESARAEALREQFPDADQLTALLVFSKSDDSALRTPEQATIGQKAAALGVKAPVQFAQDGKVGLAILPLPNAGDDEQIAETVDKLRAELRNLPEG